MKATNNQLGHSFKRHLFGRNYWPFQDNNDDGKESSNQRSNDRVDDEDELTQYIKEDRLNKDYTRNISKHDKKSNVEQLKFWKENQQKYRRLSKMAKKYLAVPSTSTPVERVFSTAAKFVPTSRSNLLPSTTKECILLHYWLNMERFKESDNDELTEVQHHQQAQHT